MYSDPNRCPVCKSKKYACIQSAGGVDYRLYIFRYGSIHLNACLHCGTVYIPRRVRQEILDKINSEE